jgi:hypothetical protein
LSTTSGAVEPCLSGGEEDPPAQRRSRLSRGRDRLARALLEHRQRLLLVGPGVVYLAIRLLGLATLAWLAAVHHYTLDSRLEAWDGQWYVQIAEHDYSGVDPAMKDGYGHRYPETSLAFFPGYPVLARLVGALVPGLSTTAAAVVVSFAAGIFAAYGLRRLTRWLGGSEKAGLLLVALFAASPMAVVLSMAYSEALFCALSVWALVAVLERRWTLAGLCCAASGLVRPTASALILVVGLAALVAIYQRRDAWRPWLAAVLAPSGMAGYIGWVALETGKPTGYFELQRRGWSSSFDGGRSTLEFMVRTLALNRSALETITVWIVLASVVLLVLCVRHRQPWPLVLFSAAVMVLDLGSDGLMYSKVRLMLPAFGLLIPVAVGLANRRTTTAVATTTLIVLFGSWFGAYSLTAWSYAI